MAEFIYFDRELLRKQLRNLNGDDDAKETSFFSMGSRKRSRWNNQFHIKQSLHKILRRMFKKKFARKKEDGR